jgi:Outer membrane protein beta-barrel domain
MKRFLPVVLLLLSFGSFAQTSGTPTPAQTLRLARATYEQGRLHEIPSQLHNDVISAMNKQEKVEAYKILCLSYIYLEEPEKADEAMLNILRTDPYFEINEAVDPAEFVALYKTFRTRPIYRIGAKLGVNATRPNVVETASAVELADGSEYKFLIGFQFGAAADLPLTKNLTLHGDLLFQQKKFNLKLEVDRGLGEGGEELTNKFEGDESQTWISLPLTVEYKFLEKKFNPYVGGGVAIDYLIGSKITSIRARENETSIEEKSYDFKPQRNALNISTVVVAGVKLRMAGGYFIAEARFIYGLTQVSSKETSYENTQYALEQGYADSVYKLTSVVVTGSYIQNIFNPKKLKRKK